MILRKKNYLFKNVFNFKYIKNIIIHSKMIYIYIYIMNLIYHLIYKQYKIYIYIFDIVILLLYIYINKKNNAIFFIYNFLINKIFLKNKLFFLLKFQKFKKNR